MRLINEWAGHILCPMTDDTLPSSSPPAPVRQAFWLATAGFLLVLGQATAAAVVRSQFEETAPALRGSAIDGQGVIDGLHFRLVAAFVLAGVVSLLLGFAAMTVPRRSESSRTIVGFVALTSVVALLLGVVFSPDSAVSPENADEVALYEMLLPAWFSTLSSVTVAGAMLLLGLAFVRMGREAAVDYYQQYDPTATWRGFTSWLDIVRR